MANENKPDTNHSQFFITLDATDWLTGKHTIFGKVVGNTLFNVLKMGELETDKEDRPLYPPMIKSTSVLVNPFDDIIPRYVFVCECELKRSETGGDDRERGGYSPSSETGEEQQVIVLC